MSGLSLFTNGIEARYDEGGFSAFGTTTSHRFYGIDHLYSGAPIANLTVHWRIDTKGQGLFEQYKEENLPPNEVSPRVQKLEDYFNNFKMRPCGTFRRYSIKGPIELRYSLEKDPFLVSFIMGVVSADREMVITAPDCRLLAEDRIAPAATVAGFMERTEPVFLVEHPILSLK